MHQNIAGLLTIVLCGVISGAMRPESGGSTADANIIRPTNSPQETTKNPNKECCLNGGLCVISFCQCRRNFYGRYCEFFMRQRPCGTMDHNTWQRRGCSLCRCVDGILTCRSRLFAGCDDVSADDSIDREVYNFRKTKQRHSKIQLSANDRNSARHWSTWPCIVITTVTCLGLLRL